MNSGLEHCHEGEYHLADEACYTRWLPYLHSENNLLFGTIHQIIQEELGIKKLCAKCVPHFPTMDKVRWTKHTFAIFNIKNPTD